MMTLEEKASLLSGASFWFTKAVGRLGVAGVAMSDGPHGVRKIKEGAKEGDVSAAYPATCFPAACATACSFDPELLYEMGQAMAHEAQSLKVDVILGPGVNIKRSPLCGRNFEYFSEDPYLAGHMAARLVDGIQSMGTGTSLKHFALNSQETRRMKAESVVDERAIYEIYLPAFEYVIKHSSPYTVMCSYNRVFGTYAASSKRLLSDILRHEMGYTGVIVSDWSAVDDRITALEAGLDLEMPPTPKHESDAELVAAVKEGRLDESFLTAAAENIVRLSEKCAAVTKKFSYDKEAHHALARKIAANSAVLLKNNGALPVERGTVAVIGAFAEHTRYQGSGSSLMQPTKVDTALDALKAAGLSIDYAPGYRMDGFEPDPALIRDAVKLAASHDTAVVFAGLPEEYESEGYDRKDMTMPKSHTALIKAVAAANPNTVVVLYGGSPMELEFEPDVNAVLLMYLGGQASALACADILTGAVNPSGKLAETWPLTASDAPCAKYFPGHNYTVEYRESIFVGYRYYLTADKPMCYPFGHGLSYTSFQYSPVKLTDGRRKGGGLTVSLTVQNIGNREGAEVVQFYAGMTGGAALRPKRVLIGFNKLKLAPHEKKTVEFTFTERDLAIYDTDIAAFVTESGEYSVEVGASSTDIRGAVSFRAGNAAVAVSPSAYYDLSHGIDIPDGAFEALLRHPIPKADRPDEPVTLSTTLNDVRDHPLGRSIIRLVRFAAPLVMGNSPDMRRMVNDSLMDTPLRSLSVMSSGAVSYKFVKHLVKRLGR